jgi:RNase H-fold protein (predicted Holliday junction resolvase)
MRLIATGLLAALLVGAPSLTAFASSPAPGGQSEACKKLLADEHRLEKRINDERTRVDVAKRTVDEANRAIKDLGNNPANASAVAAIKADRAKLIANRDAAFALEQGDKATLKALQERALRVCPSRTSK